MINELHLLSQALEKNGINVPVTHPWIKGVKQGEALLVNITKDGFVDSLEYCSPEQVQMFWNVEESNKTTFPKINADPLWGCLNHQELLKEITDAASNEDWDSWFAGINQLLESSSEIFPRDTERKNSAWKKDKWSRLYKFSHEVVLPHLSDGNEGLSELIHCFDSFEIFSEETFDRLFVQIARMLMSDLKDGRLDCFKLAQHFFIGKPGAKQQPLVTLVFNHARKEILVVNKEEAYALGRALSSADGKERGHLCPLTGKLTHGAVDKFPNPNLPLLGNTTLMSMFQEAKCHYRYGKIGTEVFPASSEAAAQLDNVLRYITSDDLKFKTWMPVASGKWEGNPKKEQRDLLICYAEELPELQNEGLAFLLGGDSDSSEQRFESISSLVCDALRKNRSSETSSRIRVFVIRKISKGQSQVVLNDFCSVADLFDAVDLWKQAASNHPPYALYLPRKKGEKAEKVSYLVPFPADLLRLLQYQWVRMGETDNDKERSKLAGCPLSSAYDLFFERGGRTQATARQTLQMIIQRIRPLLMGIGRAGNATDFDILEKYSVAAKRAVLQAVSFLGIVLFKLGYTKENYMKDAGYNIGRLLSLADCLHKEYCRHVRNEIPNQLLGNSLLQTVLDNPVRGLARLSERIAIYTAWVSRVHGEQYWLARWAKKQMGMVSERLSEATIPDSPDDALKAQILLGYLAHTESKQGNDNQGDDHE